MRSVFRFLLILTALLESSTAYGQTQAPNTFTPGTPARASEVNENFDVLEAGIDQNAADILQVQGLTSLSPEAAQIQTALNLTSGLRWLVADFFIDRGTMPQDISQLGDFTADDWRNRYVESVSVDVDIEITFRSTASASIAGQNIILRSVTPAIGIIWFDCIGNGVTDVFLNELQCAFNDQPFQPYSDIRKHVLTTFDLLEQSNALQLVQDYFNANGVWPGDNMSVGLGLPDDYQNNYVTQLYVTGSGQVVTEFGRNAEDIISGTTLRWLPTDNGGSIEWSCSSADIPNYLLPAECRT